MNPITDDMRNYVNNRRRQNRDAALEDFIEAFSHQIFDEEEAETIFTQLWIAGAAAHPDSEEKTNRASLMKDRVSEELCTAPYRFVTLNESVVLTEAQVLKAWEEQKLHDAPLVGGLSGALALSITFHGPMLIGETKGDTERPLTLGNRHVIPGATLRGLTRATLEIAAFGRLHQTNLHRRYSIRDFDHALFRDEERKKVRAGWLVPDGTSPSGYSIAPCHWWRVRIRDIAPRSATGIAGAAHLAWLKKSLEDRYACKAIMKGGVYDFNTVEHFDAPTGTDWGEGLAKPNSGAGAGAVEGVFVFSDRSPAFSRNGLTEKENKTLSQDYKPKLSEIQKDNLYIKALDFQESNHNKGDSKKTEAVFAKDPHPKLIQIDRHVWRNFELNNSKPSRHNPVPAGNWAKLRPTLVARGQRIPVFWVGDDTTVADLGLVRVFKRALPHSTQDMLRRTGKGAHIVDPDNVSPDLVDALFGFVHEPEVPGQGDAAQHDKRHLKGRVAFGFAWLSRDTPGKVTEEVVSVMSAPKPSFAPFYLASTDTKDWSSLTATLAGRKRYPARDADAAAVKTWLKQYPGKNDASSRLCFLEPKGDARLRFDGEIRVHNVTPVELGGLIWALTFGGKTDRRHLIGRAKTAGAGQAQITVTTLALQANDGGSPPDAAALLKAFEDHMEARAPGWSTSAPVLELLRSADPGFGKALKDRLKYLDLNKHRTLRKQVYDAGGSPPVNAKRPRLMGFD